MVEVRTVETAGEREDAFAVRQVVFVEEQGVDEDLEYDEHEDESTHFVAYDGGEPVGAARLRKANSGVGKVERVAVLAPYREDGVGRAVMNVVETEARSEGLESLKLHSQTHAAEFYRTLGYERYGEEFQEAGIPHVKMRKPLE
ncbi:GNAT family N-acetyltransferase [Natronorubrum daqingense]|uniref:GNAT family N-acetyltransferase n=1 Tax=Natronorubrum daqingense TaxID=588898 RepID=A0A1N7D0L3_9EURY|nr:GNAT family N-acetyltransferase [Natronorubrum daqingense]APX97143.1 GNAT family N-acetyltransferase [Natronorubrum daqingense]SIR69330.1 Predicted N-acyltransferase, GNAT family [Natronorubrum daqingense]